MGVPHLATLLEPYGKNIALGCRHGYQEHHDRSPSAGSDSPLQNEASLYRRRAIIDGPAMVHFVYSRLLSLSSTELPTYSKLSEAVVEFLTGLQEYGLEIAAIYFDGALPESKRPVRLARLESSASRLAKIKTTYPQGFPSTLRAETSRADSSLKFDTLLAASNPVPNVLSCWPIPPFIIPVCLEHLNRSAFASTVKLVTGEADSFCATDAFTFGGTVLSGDSDLLIHDLGPHGAYMPLSSLELGTCSDHSADGTSLLRGRAYRRSQIEHHLGTRDLVRVAFEVSDDPRVTLAKAVQRSTQEMTPNAVARYSSFRAMYENLPLPSEEEAYSALVGLKSLDPRVAEFVWQVENFTTGPAELHVYLPLLFEDQTRISAWAICTEVRDLGYNTAMASRMANTEGVLVVEMMRSGPKRIARRDISIQHMSQLNSEGRMWRDRIDTVQEKMWTGHSDRAFWLVLALTEVCAWYVRKGRYRPSGDQMQTLFANCGRIGPGMGSWYDIHLNAQVQAVLYSFRMLQQILRGSADLTDGLQWLKERMERLPPLVELLENHSDRINVDAAVDLVMQMEQDEEDEDVPGSTSHPEASADTKASALPHVEKKESRQRKKRSQAIQPQHTLSEEAAQSENINMYNVLANHDA